MSALVPQFAVRLTNWNKMVEGVFSAISPICTDANDLPDLFAMERTSGYASALVYRFS